MTKSFLSEEDMPLLKVEFKGVVEHRYVFHSQYGIYRCDTSLPKTMNLEHALRCAASDMMNIVKNEELKKLFDRTSQEVPKRC
jgi:hypothetical protein